MAVSAYLTIMLVHHLHEAEETIVQPKARLLSKLIAWEKIKVWIPGFFLQKAPIILLLNIANMDEIRKLKVWMLWWAHKAMHYFILIYP